MPSVGGAVELHNIGGTEKGKNLATILCEHRYILVKSFHKLLSRDNYTIFPIMRQWRLIIMI